MKSKKNDAPLLIFFLNLLDNDDEKNILKMIFKDCSDDEMLETLIDYKPNVGTNA